MFFCTFLLLIQEYSYQLSTFAVLFFGLWRSINIYFTYLTMLSSIGEVLHLLVRQDWETLRSTVLSDPTLFRNIASAIMACSEFNGMTFLHAAVRYNPPSDIIAQMIHLCPHMTAAMDCLGRTPLHVAAGSGANPEVISMIAHAYPPACDI